MVEFVAHVPHGTPDWESVFLAGGDEALGRWSATGVRLERHGDGTARALVHLPAGLRVQYLVTRGHWRAAENDGACRERPPRELVTGDDVRVEFDVQGWGRESVRYHGDFSSAHLPHARPITVYLPPGYDLEPERRYPVLYLHDGQNLFDAATAFAGVPWNCDEVAERAIRAGTVEPIIVVGVGNTVDRLREYGPLQGDDAWEDLSHAYGRFLVDELKPFIDNTYRTAIGPQRTGVGGSSMGGLISLHLCQRHPDVFGRCAAMSPSLWWDRESLLHDTGLEVGWPRGCRVWLDMGDAEGASPTGNLGNLRRTRKLARRFKAMSHIEGRDYTYREVAGGQHNEAAWSARLAEVLSFLFPARGE